MPEKEYVERSRPVVSTYRVDFKYKSNGRQVPVAVPVPVPQIIIKRPKTSFDGVPTSTYRYAHSEGGPNKGVIDASNNEALNAVHASLGGSAIICVASLSGAVCVASL
jgi:hypothetical protein